MYMRLWWKDARQFWPIWAFLVLAAGGTQLLMDQLVAPEARGGLLVPMAMGWTCLYAFVAGAAAFAGEREAGTLALLDRLPAPRRVVWTGKVSFAAVTTVALAAVLVGVAALDAPPRPGSPWGMPDDAAMLTLGAVIVQALAWGLLCSSVLPSSLLAAVAAIGLTAISRLATFDAWFGGHPVDRLTWDLGLAGIVLAGSLARFTAGRRDRRLLPAVGLPVTMRLRSPIEVSWAGRPRVAAGPAGLRSRGPIAAKGAPVEMLAPAPPVAAARPAIPAAAESADRPRPRSRSAELRALVGQTLHEGRPTWLFLAAIGMFCPWLLWNGAILDPIFLVVWNAIITLGAGVSVFGLENRRRTHRFLVHHGARPGLVWLAKLGTWGLGLAMIWAPLVYSLVSRWPIHVQGVSEAGSELIFFGLHLPLMFSVAVLCGMAIPRGITAGVVALVVSLLLGFAETGLLTMGMMPIWGLLALPAVFLATSWAWSGDWLMDRAGPGRWVRLGGVLSALLATTLGGYTGWRAWSVPDVGPIAVPSDWIAATAPLPADLNAAPLYREAATRLEVAVARGADLLELPLGQPSDLLSERQHILDLDRHREVAGLIRRATARPECQFFDPRNVTLRTRLDLPAMHELGDAVTAHALRALDRGDLAAGWDDVMLLFRMARHVRQGATLAQALQSLAIERQALGVARRWANAPGQTPERLAAGLSEYRGLPAKAPAPEVVRAEGLLAERTIDLPIDDLRDLMAEMNGSRRVLSIEDLLLLDLIATPWERARARRVNRQVIDEIARLVALEPRQRPSETWPGGPDPLPKRLGFSLVALFAPSLSSYAHAEDRTEVERRALVDVIAVREWALRHGGRFPERLDELAPGEYPTLPTDPYTGRSFGYTTLADAEERNPKADWPVSRWPAGTRLIYSVGQDRVDHHGKAMKEAFARLGGVDVFPIFPAGGEKKR